MPTVIDSLIVELGLDPKAFEKGQKEAAAQFLKTKQSATQQAKEIEAAGKQAAQFFSKLRNEALAFFGTLVAAHGLKDFIADITQADASTGRLARTLDIAGKTLGSLQGAVQFVGGSAGDIAGTLASLTNSLQRITAFGDTSILEPLARLGISAFGPNGALKNASDILFELNARVQGMDPARASAFLTALGIDRNTQYLILQSRDAFRQMYEAAKKLAPTQRDLQAAAERQRQWVMLSLTLTQIGRTILTDLTPAIGKALIGMQNWVTENKNWLETDISRSLKSLVATIGDIARGVGIVERALGGWERTTEILFSLWLGEKFLKVLANIALLRIAFFGTAGTAAAASGEAAAGIGLGAVAAIVAGASAGSTPNPDPTSKQMDEAQRREAQAAGVDPATWARMSWWEKAKRLWGAKPRAAGWWTPERQQHAITRLMKEANLSEQGARALVARWATVELPGGPTSVNPRTGAFGIEQDLGSRKVGIAGDTNFDDQLTHAIKQLNSTESRAAAMLRSNDLLTAATGASAYERAEGYNPSTGTDNFTAATAAAMLRSAKMASISNNNSRTAHVSSQTHIGSISVHTSATDGAGIAKDLKQSIDQYSFVNLANYGAL